MAFFRKLAFAALLLVLGSACERKREQARLPTVANDAARADRSHDTNDIERRLRELSPPYPPPAPTVRRHARGDCRTDYAPRPDRDPNPMCLVHGGKFSMGGGAYAPEATPRSMAIEDFYIDQFEVTTQQAVLFLNAHGNSCLGLDKDERTGPYAHQCVNAAFDAASKLTALDGILEHGGRFEVKPGFELKPEADFSFEGAMRYCEWVGKEVPSSAQWEYAARHDPVTGADLVFPWGDTWLPDHAACWGCIGSARPAQLPLVGMYDGTNGRADGSSPWGVHDMAGGASELVFECADPNTTCRTGEHCGCRTYATFDDHRDVMALASSSRIRLEYVGDQGVRCVRPAK